MSPRPHRVIVSFLVIFRAWCFFRYVRGNNLAKTLSTRNYAPLSRLRLPQTRPLELLLPPLSARRRSSQGTGIHERFSSLLSAPGRMSGQRRKLFHKGPPLGRM